MLFTIVWWSKEKSLSQSHTWQISVFLKWTKIQACLYTVLVLKFETAFEQYFNLLQVTTESYVFHGYLTELKLKLKYSLLNINYIVLERISIQHRKSKTEANILPDHNKWDNPKNQSGLEANKSWKRQAWENACEHVTIGFVFTSSWLKEWFQFFNQ